MTKQFLQHATLVVVLCFLAAGMASAGSYTVPFPSAGDAYFSATSGSGVVGDGNGFQWTAGDYVISPIFNLNLTGVVSLTTNFLVQDYLGNGNTETWFLYLNGIKVSSFVLPDDGYNGDILNVNLAASFAKIGPSGGGYQLELVEQNTVPFGGGSVLWLDGGTANLVPEPGSLAIVGSSLAILGGFLRRKINVKTLLGRS